MRRRRAAGRAGRVPARSPAQSARRKCVRRQVASTRCRGYDVAHRGLARPRLAVYLGFPCGLGGPTLPAHCPAPRRRRPPDESGSTEGTASSQRLVPPSSDARSSTSCSNPRSGSPGATPSVISGWRRPANGSHRSHSEDLSVRIHSSLRVTPLTGGRRVGSGVELGRACFDRA